jgi:hypothetical protein
VYNNCWVAFEYWHWRARQSLALELVRCGNMRAIVEKPFTGDDKKSTMAPSRTESTAKYWKST